MYRCWVPLHWVSFSKSVNVLSNKISIVVVLESQTSCAHLVKVFIVVALCEVGLKDDLSSNLLVCGFPYTVICSSLLSRLTKKAREGIFHFLLFIW